MHGFVAWDVSMNPTSNLITWEDRRLTVQEAQRLDPSLQPGYGAATLLWDLGFGNLQLSIQKIPLGSLLTLESSERTSRVISGAPFHVAPLWVI